MHCPSLFCCYIVCLYLTGKWSLEENWQFIALTAMHRLCSAHYTDAWDALPVSRPCISWVGPLHNVSLLQDSAFRCISLLYLWSLFSTFASSLNPACSSNINADVVTVLRIRLIHAIRHASQQSASLTQGIIRTGADIHSTILHQRHENPAALNTSLGET